VEVLCAFTPFAPDEPSSEVIGSNVLIEWNAPAANGSPLIGYRVMIRKADQTTFDQELTHCDGSEYVIFTMTACTIPLSALTASTFDLTMGMYIYVKVIAYNSYGDSEESILNQGAQIVLVPDTPTDLRNDILITDAFQIGLEWTPGLSDGGEVVAFYKIMYDQGLGMMTTLVEEVYDTKYTMTSPVTQGTTYTFKVQARNSVGYSLFSNEASILAAQIPNQPSAPATQIDGSTVLITWLAPNQRGSTISSYTIEVIQYDGVSYAEDTTNCLGSDPTIIANL
jgi:hypothetical protein